MSVAGGTLRLSDTAYAVVFSLVLHACVIGLMLMGWHAEPELKRLPEIPPHVMAVPIEKPAPVPDTRPVSKPKPKPKPKPAPTPRPEPRPVPAPTQTAPVQPAPDLSPRFEQPSLEELIAREELELAQAKREQATTPSTPAPAPDAPRSAEDIPEVMQYVAAIRTRVAHKWSRPPSARNGMKTELRIRLLPGGEVLDVTVSQSSGDVALDRSAVNAVKLAGVLPVPSGELFDQHFRVFTFIFRPEDLRL